jgi:hypothetical protein
MPFVAIELMLVEPKELVGTSDQLVGKKATGRVACIAWVDISILSL